MATCSLPPLLCCSTKNFDFFRITHEPQHRGNWYNWSTYTTRISVDVLLMCNLPPHTIQNEHDWKKENRKMVLPLNKVVNLFRRGFHLALTYRVLIHDASFAFFSSRIINNGTTSTKWCANYESILLCEANTMLWVLFWTCVQRMVCGFNLVRCFCLLN